MEAFIVNNALESAKSIKVSLLTLNLMFHKRPVNLIIFFIVMPHEKRKTNNFITTCHHIYDLGTDRPNNKTKLEASCVNIFDIVNIK